MDSEGCGPEVEIGGVHAIGSEHEDDGVARTDSGKTLG
jgi:hypothetical protein